MALPVSVFVLGHCAKIQIVRRRPEPKGPWVGRMCPEV